MLLQLVYLHGVTGPDHKKSRRVCEVAVLFLEFRLCIVSSGIGKEHALCLLRDAPPEGCEH